MVINEFMASNDRSIADEDNEYDDWIEIYNNGSSTINLSDHYITDDLDNLTKWRIPNLGSSITNLAPERYVIIWADKENNPLWNHANFKLSSEGEFLAIVSSDGITILDSITFKEQYPDISYGRYRDGSNNWGYMEVPTPGSSNTFIVDGYVSPVKFSVERMVRETQFNLALTCKTEGAEIFYTLDGSIPSKSNGQKYSNSISISNTKTIRAKAYKDGWITSDLESNTFIFPEKVIQQSNLWSTITNHSSWKSKFIDSFYDIPSVSILTSESITESEVKATIEYIMPDGAEGFHEVAGIEHYGSGSLAYPKKGMRVSFKSIYGNPKLRYDIFGEPAVNKFDQILLRAGSHDNMFWSEGTKGIYIRNRLMNTLSREMGHHAPYGKFIHLFINGSYWGQYNITERPNASYMETYFGGNEEDYTSINKGVIIDGYQTVWDNLAASTDIFFNMSNHFDLENYADYMLLQFYGGNDWDWHPNQNWMASGNNVAPMDFQFFHWDSDMILRRGLHTNVVGYGGPSNLWNKVISHDAFKLLFADRAQKFLFNNGVLTKENVTKKINSLVEEIDLSIIPETARWGKQYGYTPTIWQTTVDYVVNSIVEGRTEVVIQQLRDANLLPDLNAPTFLINDFSPNSMKFNKGDKLTFIANGDIYYTLNGEDPYIPKFDESNSEIILVDENYNKSVFLPTGTLPVRWNVDENYNTSNWINNTGIVGYERGFGYQDIITIDVIAMHNSTSSCLIRIPFNITSINIEDIKLLKLGMQYDDGFVAYLNGIEVSRNNFIGTPNWNSTAIEGHEATSLDFFDISEHRSLLKNGENLLAIHGLNFSISSSDFLISSTLIADTSQNYNGTLNPNAVLYSSPIILDSNVLIKARAKNEYEWSPVIELPLITDNIVNVENNDLLPHQHSLKQNFPNPFNPTTTINYDIPSIHDSPMENKKTRVKLIVFDVLGNKVKTLVDEIVKPGSYSIEFNASNLSTGVYYYQLVHESFVKTKKMLLLK